MKRNQCPACGSGPYLGGRCRNCFYVPFAEEIAHRNHFDAGEPLVLEKNPVSRTSTQECKPIASPMRRLVFTVLAVVGALVLCMAVPGMAMLFVLAAVAFLGYRKTKDN